MGGEISIDDLNKLPKDIFDNKPDPKQDVAFRTWTRDVQNETLDEAVTVAISALTEIALETENAALADSCRDLIQELLTEYAASGKKEAGK